MKIKKKLYKITWKIQIIDKKINVYVYIFYKYSVFSYKIKRNFFEQKSHFLKIIRNFILN